MLNVRQRDALRPSPAMRKMPRHVAWRLQAQIGNGAPGGLTTGTGKSGHDSEKPGRVQEIALSTQGGARRTKCHLDKFQKRQEDET